MCGRNVSLLFRVTPSVLTVSESGTAVPARSMLESKGKVRRRCHEPNKIASDLSGFIHSFIPAISIAPVQVLYYSEALQTTARILHRSFTPKRTGNCR